MKEKEDRGPLDLTLLVEQHAKEKWELTQQLSKAAEELTIFKGTKKLVGDMSVDLMETKKQLKEVEEELVILKKSQRRHNNPPEKMTIFDEEREKFKKVQQILIKEENKELKEEQKVKALDTTVSGLRDIIDSKQKEITGLNIRIAELLEIDGAHQRQMGKLQVRLTEIEEDNKKLAHQVEDLKLNGVRKAGL